MKYEFFAGSYGSAEEENIVRFSLDAETGQLERVYGCRGIENPSWLSLSGDGTMLYAVEELAPEGRLRALEIEEGGLKPVADLSTEGADPCHICMDEQERHLLVSNYTSGSLIALALDEKGIPVQATDFIQHTGSGKNPVRQEGPHIHFGRFRGNQVFVVNLGTDLVSAYELDAATGKLADTGKGLRLPDGAGPRHLVFHPEIPGLVYVACELDSSVAFFREKDGAYALEAMVSALPEGYFPENTAAAIRIQDDQLFVSNRGHDSIAVFSLQEDGRPVLRQTAPTGGRIPRDFVILKDYIIVANQGSDEITVLRIHPETKLPEPTGISAFLSRPTCICPFQNSNK